MLTMKVSLFFMTIMSAFGVTQANLEGVPIGGIFLQLQSKAEADDADAFILELIKHTVSFMDERLQAHYAIREEGEIFSHTGLAIDSFELENEDDRHFATVGLEGTIFYATSPPPSYEKVTNIIAEVFQGSNNRILVNTLMDSDDAFLSRLSYAIVKINGYVVSSPSDTGNQVTEEEKGSLFGSSTQTLAILVAAAGNIVLLIIMCYCFCFVCTSGEREHSRDNTNDTELKIQHSKSNTSKTEQIEDASSIGPSSIHSMISQDSSLFTYNPSSRISFDASTLSTVPHDIGQMDIEAWQKRGMQGQSRSMPFGADISAIEMLAENKKDLSLIEEGDESNSPSKHADYLSKDYLSRIENRERSNLGSSTSSFFGISASDSDIIEELKNLSQQIDQHRRR